MKTLKYFFIGALMLSIGTPAMAQDNKAIIEQATQAVKSKTADVKSLLKEYKKNPDVLVGIGRVYLQEKDTLHASQFAEAALKKDGKYAPAFILLGDVAVLKDDGGGAAQMYQQAKYFDPKNPEAYVKYARILRGRSPEEAVSNLEELRTQIPDYPVDAEAGRIYFEANKFEKALNFYSRVDPAKLREDDINNYATAAYFLQKRDESLKMALYGLTRNARRAGFNRLTFYNYTDMEKFDEALTYADHLFNASDSAKISGYDYTYYGTALLGANRPDDAIEAYKKAIEANEGNKELQNSNRKSIADALKAKKDYVNAALYYEEYLKNEAKPSAVDLMGLGNLYQSYASTLKGEEQKAAFMKADDAFRRLGEVYPENIDLANLMRARIQSTLDPETTAGLAKPLYEAIVTSLEANTARDESDNKRLEEAYRYLGYYYLVKDDKANSDIYWNKLLQLDPNNEIAKKALGITK